MNRKKFALSFLVSVERYIYVLILQWTITPYLTTVMPLPKVREGKVSNNGSYKNFAFKNPVVILISFDGFRWDYFDRAELKNFNYIIKNGVKAKSLKSSFITKTFPNHFTLVSGLNEESHGIIANKMFDPLYNETFFPNSTESKWWNASLPIWIKNELHTDLLNGTIKKNNSSRKSATIFWVGSNVEYNGRFPYFYMPVYNASFPFEERFDLIIKLLKEDNPPNFFACYISEPDRTGHQHGPDSREITSVLLRLDAILGDFLHKLRSNGFLELVNLVIVSDHGMANIQPDNQIVLDDIIDPNWYTAVNIDVFSTIIPKENFTDRILKKLRKVPNLTVYLKEKIPTIFHYKNNRRVPKIFALADEGYLFTKKKMNLTHVIGNHGYMNDKKSMHGIFIAAGPAFKKSYIGETFSNIHVYSLLCRVLGIEPSPNNGSLDAVEHFLIKSLQTHKTIFETLSLKIAIFIVIGVLIVTILVGIIWQCKGSNHFSSNGYTLASRSTEGMYLYNLTEDFVIREGSSDDDEI